MDRSHTPIVLQENTQKSIENMNFELKRSILPQFQSLPKFTFSTNNISQKIGIPLNFCITFFFNHKKGLLRRTTPTTKKGLLKDSDSTKKSQKATLVNNASWENEI